MTHNDDDRLTGRHYIAAMLVALFLLGVAAVLIPVKASASEPYGGCKEVVQGHHVYVHTAGAKECRRLGWVVRPNLVVGPRGWVQYSNLPHCPNEDGSGTERTCSWNFHGHQDGNGYGDMYYVLHHDNQGDWYMGVRGIARGAYVR